MYGEVSSPGGERYPLAEFTDAYGEAQKSATVTAVDHRRPRGG